MVNQTPDIDKIFSVFNALWHSAKHNVTLHDTLFLNCRHGFSFLNVHTFFFLEAYMVITYFHGLALFLFSLFKCLKFFELSKENKKSWRSTWTVCVLEGTWEAQTQRTSCVWGGLGWEEECAWNSSHSICPLLFEDFSASEDSLRPHCHCLSYWKCTILTSPLFLNPPSH